MENESRSGCSAGQDGQGHFRMKFSHRGRCEQDANVQDERGRKTTGKVVTDEQGAPKVAGMLRNEPGALFLQCSLFLFPFYWCYSSRQIFHH